jgi:hypothetical protein
MEIVPKVGDVFLIPLDETSAAGKHVIAIRENEELYLQSSSCPLPNASRRSGIDKTMMTQIRNDNAGRVDTARYQSLAFHGVILLDRSDNRSPDGTARRQRPTKGRWRQANGEGGVS